MKPRQKHIQTEVEQCFVNLRGMDVVGIRFVAGWILDRPGKFTHFSETTAGGQAANPAESVTECDAGRQGIREFPQRNLARASVKNRRQRGAYEPAIKYETAFLHLENLRDRFSCE